jgi:hypothetical protein
MITRRAENAKGLPFNIYPNKYGYDITITRRPKGGRKWRKHQAFVPYRHPNALQEAIVQRDKLLLMLGSKSFIRQKSNSNTGLVGITKIKSRQAFYSQWRDASGKRSFASYSYGRVRSEEEALKLAYNHRVIALQRRAKREGNVQEEFLES